MELGRDGRHDVTSGGGVGAADGGSPVARRPPPTASEEEWEGFWVRRGLGRRLLGAQLRIRRPGGGGNKGTAPRPGVGRGEGGAAPASTDGHQVASTLGQWIQR